MDIDAALDTIGGPSGQLPPALPPMPRSAMPPPPPPRSYAQQSEPSSQPPSYAREAAAAPAGVPPLQSNFKEPMLQVLDVLLRLAAINRGLDMLPSDQYDGLKSALQPNPVSVQAALQQIAGVPPQQWAQAAAALTVPQREDMHAKFLLYGQSLLDSVREIGQGVSTLRLVMQRVLPALQSLPEDAQYSTSAVLRDHYTVFNTVADLMQPEAKGAANAAVQTASQKAAALAAQVQDLGARMKKAGLDPATPANDSKPQSTTIVLGVLLGIVLLAFIGVLVGWLVERKKNVRSSTVARLGGIVKPSQLRMAAPAPALPSSRGVSPFQTAPQPYMKFPVMPQWGD